MLRIGARCLSVNVARSKSDMIGEVFVKQIRDLAQMFVIGPLIDKRYMHYKEFDVTLMDINEHELELIGRTYKIPHLGAGAFSSPAFPVNGHIINPNLRFMIPLVCQLAGESNKPSVIVWFLVNTSAPFTSLTMKSLKALKAIVDTKESINPNSFFEIRIQDKNRKFQCQVSKAHYNEVNILGADVLRQSGLWMHGNWKNRGFQLYKQ